MADDIVVSIGVDESDAVKGIKVVERELRTLERETDDASAAFKKLERETEDVKQEFRRLEGELRDAEKELKDVAKQAKKADGAFGGLSGAAGKLGGALSAAAVGAFVLDASRGAREAVVLADSLDISAGAVRAMALEMEKIGGDLTDVRGFLIATSTAVDDLRLGTGPAVEEMARLGLTVDDFKDKDLLTQFRLIKKAASEFGGTTAEATAAIANMYGDEDAARIMAMADDFEDIEDEAVRAAAEIDREFAELTAELKKGATYVVSVAVEGTGSFIEAFRQDHGSLWNLLNPLKVAETMDRLAEEQAQKALSEAKLARGELPVPQGSPMAVTGLGGIEPDAIPSPPSVTLTRDEIIEYRHFFNQGLSQQDWLNAF